MSDLAFWKDVRLESQIENLKKIVLNFIKQNLNACYF